jgi:hypothetical protein
VPHEVFRMRELSPQTLSLDYDVAGHAKKFLPNLSTLAVAGDYLWTASDEARTIECLAPFRSGYRLHRQFQLDMLFPDLPGARLGHEADIEALILVGPGSGADGPFPAFPLAANAQQQARNPQAGAEFSGRTRSPLRVLACYDAATATARSSYMIPVVASDCAVRTIKPTGSPCRFARFAAQTTSLRLSRQMARGSAGIPAILWLAPDFSECKRGSFRF